jgi:hypothetical protein
MASPDDIHWSELSEFFAGEKSFFICSNEFLVIFHIVAADGFKYHCIDSVDGSGRTWRGKGM